MSPSLDDAWLACKDAPLSKVTDVDIANRNARQYFANSAYDE